MKVITGKGKEYSEVSKEIENYFFSWLEAQFLSVKEFDQSIKSFKEIQLERNKEGIRVSLILDDKELLPFVWDSKSNIKQKDFLTDLLLLLFYIVGRYENKKFELSVKKLAKQVGFSKKKYRLN